MKCISTAILSEILFHPFHPARKMLIHNWLDEIALRNTSYPYLTHLPPKPCVFQNLCKCACNYLIINSLWNDLQNRPFCLAKWAFLPCEMDAFAGLKAWSGLLVRYIT